MTVIEMPGAPDLCGRTIGLNLSVCRKFTCRGFFLSSTRPAAMVDPEADQLAIRTGLLDGRLVDITDAASHGLSMAGASHTRTGVEDTGKKFYYGRDEQGRLFVVIPKDEADAAAIEKEIAETGTLRRNCEAAANFSGITTVETGPVIPIVLTDPE